MSHLCRTWHKEIETFALHLNGERAENAIFQNDQTKDYRLPLYQRLTGLIETYLGWAASWNSGRWKSPSKPSNALSTVRRRQKLAAKHHGIYEIPRFSLRHAISGTYQMLFWLSCLWITRYGAPCAVVISKINMKSVFLFAFGVFAVFQTG